MLWRIILRGHVTHRRDFLLANVSDRLNSANCLGPVLDEDFIVYESWIMAIDFNKEHVSNWLQKDNAWVE